MLPSLDDRQAMAMIDAVTRRPGPTLGISAGTVGLGVLCVFTAPPLIAELGLIVAIIAACTAAWVVTRRPFDADLHQRLLTDAEGVVICGHQWRGLRRAVSQTEQCAADFTADGLRVAAETMNVRYPWADIKEVRAVLGSLDYISIDYRRRQWRDRRPQVIFPAEGQPIDEALGLIASDVKVVVLHRHFTRWTSWARWVLIAESPLWLAGIPLLALWSGLGTTTVLGATNFVLGAVVALVAALRLPSMRVVPRLVAFVSTLLRLQPLCLAVLVGLWARAPLVSIPALVLLGLNVFVVWGLTRGSQTRADGRPGRSTTAAVA